MKIFSDAQTQTITNEAYETIKTGADVVQFAGSKIIENPVKAAGIFAMFALAIGGFKFMVNDIIEFKK